MTNNEAIIYLLRDKFDYFSPVSGKVLEFKFVPEIINDLEVVNPDLLENLIRLFLANNKIIPSNLSIVIGDSASFIKDFQTQNINTQVQAPGSLTNAVSFQQVDTSDEIKDFIDHVPFEDVASQQFPVSNGVKVWATNKSLYETIVRAFERHGFSVKSVLPGVVFSGSLSARPALDVSAGYKILQEIDMVRDRSLEFYNFVEPSVIVAPAVNNENKDVQSENLEVSEKPSDAKSKKRLFILIGLFAILISIMVIMFIMQKPLG